MKNILPGLFFLMLFSSCEKDINFNLKEAENVLVVDAVIENNQPPMVVLTKSLNYFSSISPAILANLFVRNAVVTISNGMVTHQLKEYSIPTPAGINLYTYGIDSANLSTAFLGEFNTNYSLRILSEGKEYVANTSIRYLAKKMDSLWWNTAPFQPDSSKVILNIKATDPAGLGDYVRYFTRRNSGSYLPGENSVFDDQVVDGTTYSFKVDQGIDRNNRQPFDSNYFKRGDTITLKLCNIDKPTYTFWNTWEFNAQSIGNPFSQPGKVIGNISNGALGAFYGYAADYKTLIVPR
jgi:hypothetical protein